MKAIILAVMLALSVGAHSQVQQAPPVNQSCAALIKTNDSLRTALFNANYRLQRVKYYLRICLKRPSQDKFLKGWILRAVK